MMLEFLLVAITQGIITKTYGEVADFSYTTSGFVCQNGYSTSKTITFSGSFANVPKIIFVPTIFDFASFSSSQFTVKLEILSVSLTNFQIKITCPTKKVNTYKLSWFAIDDNRLEVINEAINDININPVASKQYSIQNPNIKKAIASIHSYGINGALDITLSISELTTTQVTVNIAKNSNLLYLGYQVILGTDEVISYIDEIASSNSYTSQVYNLISDNYFVVSFTKLTNSGTNAFRLQYFITKTSTTIYYDCSTWGGAYPSNIMKVFWLQTTLNQEFLAMECLTVRVSKLFDRYVDLKPAFQLEILEINKVLNTVGSESIVLNESIQLVTIHVFYKCPSNNKKVHSQLNKCNSCTGTNQIHNLNHYCHGSVNSINIYAKYQAQANYKELTLTRASNGVTIAQTLRNRSTSQKNILKVDFLDI
ncbi:unnamed protein product (macronuclear) [Paramecium tetraurelia]|uniref:H-type lectin domain-containing protein n=1 Tax=Paramecium tetraurelia TaxID=5888 RepID=A0E2B6_PARTE|nr:uncharacterized protein GSPATT00022605001 [Paramecium tetraurelia]CAK89433.1 unnamed protein product [Paramecium tetraurelia]|eukprot:XP_001456830.1 hypothetical protein (macronuclear) [Paramecium tetraurelia strain d4-2]